MYLELFEGGALHFRLGSGDDHARVWPTRFVTAAYRSGYFVRRWSSGCAVALGLLLSPWAVLRPGAPAEAGANPGGKEFLAAVLAKLPPSVRWPRAAFGGPSDPFVIGLRGEDLAKPGGVLAVSLADRILHVFAANARKARLEVDARLLKIDRVHR